MPALLSSPHVQEVDVVARLSSPEAVLPHFIQGWLCRSHLVWLYGTMMVAAFAGLVVPWGLHGRTVHGDLELSSAAVRVLGLVEPTALAMLCFALGGVGMAIHARSRLRNWAEAGFLRLDHALSASTLLRCSIGLAGLSLVMWLIHIFSDGAAFRAFVTLEEIFQPGVDAGDRVYWGDRLGLLRMVPIVVLAVVLYAAWWSDFARLLSGPGNSRVPLSECSPYVRIVHGLFAVWTAMATYGLIKVLSLLLAR